MAETIAKLASTSDGLKARFAYVRQDLEGVLGRLHDADLGWAPREGMPTIADLLLEIANKEKETLVWIQTGVWPDGDADAFDLGHATLATVRGALEGLRLRTYAYIDSQTEADLSEPIPNPESWWEGMRQPECPRAEVIRNIAAHEWYHTAQLVTYLWIRGDNPANW